MDVTLDVAARTATGSSTVRFTPDLDTDRIVLRLWPNSPVARRAGGSMAVRSLRVDGTAVTPRPSEEPTLLELPVPVAAGRSVTVESAWTITLAADLAERWTVVRGAVRLGSFVPLLPWEPGVGWATDPPTLVHGEATTSPVADWDVGVDARGLDVVVSGQQGDDGRWRAQAIRDIGLSAGRWRRAEASAAAGEGGARVPVVVVADASVAEDPAAYAARAAKALESMSGRFGPYPYPIYSLALTAGLKGGIEQPMLVMQGPGTLGRSTSHEVAHQWFYALVGNDQGRDPWLDEGLASWAEARFEGTLASMRAQVIPAAGKGRAGQPTRFFDDKVSAYYRSVYVQPVQALAALGPPALVDCVLARWVQGQAHSLAVPATLKSELTETFPNAAAVLAPYGL